MNLISLDEAIDSIMNENMNIATVDGTVVGVKRFFSKEEVIDILKECKIYTNCGGNDYVWDEEKTG